MAEWLAAPFLFDAYGELGSLLAQLFEEGYGERHPDAFLLSWSDVYRLLGDNAYIGALAPLGLPPRTDIRPAMNSRGSLTEREFSVVISGWVDGQGIPVSPEPKLTGSVAIVRGQERLLTEAAWRVVQQVAGFHQRPAETRDADSNRLHWSEIRRQAVAADAKLADFLQKTVVLKPEQLRIGMRKHGEAEAKTVELTPDFDDAPSRWIEMFDRFPDVPDRYEIPDGQGLVHVLVPPEVKTVLREIKRMPGRRVAGARAEAFVRNPFSLLGPDANKVVDEKAFDEERERAELNFERFTPMITRGEDGALEKVGLLIETTNHGEPSSEDYYFASSDELGTFIAKLSERLKRESQCCAWKHYELEILGDTPDHLTQLRRAFDEWTAPRRIAFTEIFDLSKYSDRVEGIGEEKQYALGFIAKKDDEQGWFPDNVIFGLQFADGQGDEPVHLPMDVGQLEELAGLVEDARANGRTHVAIPGHQAPIPFAEAEQLVATFGAARKDIESGRFSPDGMGKPKRVERKHLVLKANIDTVDYAEERTDLLELPADARPTLPRTLRPTVTLKEHQHYGVSWLQHLWRLSPGRCRGALLADDMGLGKTIQLLTFISSALEQDEALPPVLIVAPVALLENWKEEIDKFFVPGAMPVLTLYGDALAEKRLPKNELDEELQSQGITRLLRPDWLGNAKVVLTTYETLRDLEFSLAAQHWSIMVCDESQKIKNPNAMVTRAAKKQNVRFRIACTGTPVENTLADLWCLFDFIQPGLLGSLSEFSRRYRKPIEAETDEEKERVEELRRIVRPQLLRREKKDVAKDLPAKIEDKGCRALPISGKQRGLYARAISHLNRTSANGGSAHLGVLQFLRRLCSDPMLEDQYEADRASVEDIILHSPKMAWLMESLATVRQRQEKAIVFCEFRDLQRTLQRSIATRFDIHPDIINGDTTASASHADSRQKRIRAFQQKPGFGVIILSPLAVGFGVNIQAANHVIHFTRTWNPAKEDQATDRAYRIGQERDVYVYYPVVVAEDFTTFDQKLDQLLDWKRGLSQDMLNGSGEISVKDFLDLKDSDGQPLFDPEKEHV